LRVLSVKQKGIGFLVFLPFNFAGRAFSSKERYLSFQLKYSVIYLEENIGAVSQFFAKV